MGIGTEEAEGIPDRALHSFSSNSSADSETGDPLPQCQHLFAAAAASSSSSPSADFAVMDMGESSSDAGTPSVWIQWLRDKAVKAVAFMQRSREKQQWGMIMWRQLCVWMTAELTKLSK